MSEMLSEAFDALLEVHGTDWKFRGRTFRAVAQSGAYAAYNFVDGNTAVKILRYRTSALSRRPAKGDIVTNASGKSAFVQNSREIDGDFSELEVDEV